MSITPKTLENTLDLMDALKEEVKASGAEGSIESYGAMSALEEMIPHWQSHLNDGESPGVVVNDLKALEDKVRAIRHLFQDHIGVTSSSEMTVSVDGGKTFEPAPNGVRVSYSSVMVCGEDEEGQMDVTLTHEGIITDLWVSREDHLDHNIATDSRTLEDIQSEMVIENE